MTAITPTTNPELPFRPGGFSTLAEGLDYAAGGATGFNFFSPRGELVEALPYRGLRERALELASRLAGGVPRGERVALLAETSPDFMAAFFACQYAGLVPVPLPLCVNIGGHEPYVRRLHAMLAAADVRLVLGPADLAATLAEAARGTAAAAAVGTTADVAAWRRAAGRLRPLGPGEPCYVQYSSGSTSLPRGVLVTQRALAANAGAIATHGLALSAGDRCTSWLPLYHDMGLVGCCLTPALAQVSVDYIPSTAFARRPLLWLQLLSRHGGTVSFGPTFGYELCVRRTEGGLPEGLDLRRWRVAGVGGEMIRPDVLEAFAARFAPAGFDPGSFVPSYGLAEATLAVTFSRLGGGVAVDAVARGRTLEAERRAVPARPDGPRPARRFVVCGGPMPGYAVEVRDARGSPLPDRRLGRVCVKGPSLMAGYHRDEAASAGVLLDGGWLDTGDIGYLVDGELVVTGRSKDLIIVGGRNIWPQDVEWAVERLDGVRAGDVAAFATSDDGAAGERVVVVVECRAADGAAREALRSRVAGAVRRTAGVESEVVLAAPRSLTFTTSGKLSRAAARADYLSGAIRDVGAVAAVVAATAPPVPTLVPAPVTPPAALPAVANLAEPLLWRAAS